MGLKKFVKAPKLGKRLFGQSGNGIDKFFDSHRGDLARAGAGAVGVNPAAAEAIVGSNIKRSGPSSKR